MIKFCKISVLCFAAFLNLAAAAQAANCSAPNSIIKVENKKIGPNEYVNFYLRNQIPEIEVTAA